MEAMPAGHFTLDGARYVAGELGTGAGEIFDAIAGLVEKSLMATRTDEAQAQYRLLDTTRAFRAFAPAMFGSAFGTATFFA
jgi:predicted ATPase